MPDLVLYQLRAMRGLDSLSPFCTKVRRALVFKGVSHEVQVVSSQEDVRLLNPRRRKLPVLEHNGKVVVDSTNILQFLDERYPAPALYPEDPYSRSQALLLEDWADESLYWIVVYLWWAVDENFSILQRDLSLDLGTTAQWVLPRVERQRMRWNLRAQGLGRLTTLDVLRRLDEHLDCLEALLWKDWYLTGPALTAADVAAFAMLQGLSSRYAPQARERIQKRRRLRDWYQDVDARTQPE